MKTTFFGDHSVQAELEDQETFEGKDAEEQPNFASLDPAQLE